MLLSNFPKFLCSLPCTLPLFLSSSPYFTPSLLLSVDIQEMALKNINKLILLPELNSRFGFMFSTNGVCPLGTIKYLHQVTFFFNLIFFCIDFFNLDVLSPWCVPKNIIVRNIESIYTFASIFHSIDLNLFLSYRSIFCFYSILFLRLLTSADRRVVSKDRNEGVKKTNDHEEITVRVSLNNNNVQVIWMIF